MAEEMKPGDSSKILFYSGYKGNETPRYLLTGGERHRIQVRKRERRWDDSQNAPVNVFTCTAGPYSFQVEVYSEGDYKIS